MKINVVSAFILCVIFGLSVSGCSKTNEDNPTVVTYTLSSDKTEVEVGERITFIVTSSTGEDVTDDWSMCDETFCFTNNWASYSEPGTHTVSAHLRTDENVSAQNTLTITVTGDPANNDDGNDNSVINPNAQYVLRSNSGDTVFVHERVVFSVQEIVDDVVVNENVGGFKLGPVGAKRADREFISEPYYCDKIGTYELDAVLYFIKDGVTEELYTNKLTITAVDKQSAERTENFYHRSLFVKWTASWCGSCPFMEETIVDIMQYRTNDVLVPIAIHSPKNDACYVFTEMGDIYNQTTEDFNITGIPGCSINFNEKWSGVVPSYSVIVNNIYASIDVDPEVVPGLAITTSLSGRSLSGTLKTSIREDGDYLLGVFFVEDGVETYQNGTKDNRMIQDNVVHFSLTDGSDTPFGLYDCGTLTAGQEFQMPISFNIPVHNKPADFVFDNCRLVYMVFKKDSSIQPYGLLCANVSSVKIGQSADYEYDVIL